MWFSFVLYLFFIFFCLFVCWNGYVWYAANVISDVIKKHVKNTIHHPLVFLGVRVCVFALFIDYYYIPHCWCRNFANKNSDKSSQHILWHPKKNKQINVYKRKWSGSHGWLNSWLTACLLACPTIIKGNKNRSVRRIERNYNDASAPENEFSY